MSIIVCVTGSRDWTDPRPIEDALDAIWAEYTYAMTLIHGGAPGADSIAHHWGQRKEQEPGVGFGFVVCPFPAEWNKHQACLCRDRSTPTCKGAGAFRNRTMGRYLSESMQRGEEARVLAFSTRKPMTPGTADMVKVAKKLGIRGRTVYGR